MGNKQSVTEPVITPLGEDFSLVQSNRFCALNHCRTSISWTSNRFLCDICHTKVPKQIFLKYLWIYNSQFPGDMNFSSKQFIKRFLST